MRQFTFSASLCALLLATFAGCQSDSTASDATKALVPLEETTWTATSIDGVPVVTVENGKPPRLSLQKSDKRVVAFGGVNGMGGTYMLDGPTLRFSALVGTKMAGPEPLNKQEYAFAQALEKVDGYRIADRTLTLTSSGASVMILEAK